MARSVHGGGSHGPWGHGACLLWATCCEAGDEASILYSVWMLSWFNVKIRAWPAHGATHDCVREQPRGSLDWEHRWALSLLPPPGRLSRRSQRKPICSAPPPAPTPSTLPKLRRAHVPASLPTPISHGSPVLHGPQCPQSPTFPFAAPAVDKSTAQNFTQSPPGNRRKYV